MNECSINYVVLVCEVVDGKQRNKTMKCEKYIKPISWTLRSYGDG